MHRVDQYEYQKRGISSRKLPSGKVDAEDELELKEVRKAWKESDLVGEFLPFPKGCLWHGMAPAGEA